MPGFNYSLLNLFSYITSYYLISIVSLVGFFLNLASINLLTNKRLKHKFYKYLKCKSICDTAVCLLGIGYLNSNCFQCVDGSYGTFAMLFYKLYIIKFAYRITLLSSALSEIYLNLNRIFSFSNRNNLLNNMPVKYYMTCVVLTPVVFAVIPYLGVEIKRMNESNMYSVSTTSFGKTAFFQYYVLLSLALESVLPTLILISINLVVLIKFRQRMNFKINMNIQTTSFIKKTEVRFTKMILILTGTFTLTRFLDMISAISYRYVNYFQIKCDEDAKSAINFFRQFTYLLLFLQYVFNIFVYVKVDPNLRRLLKLSWIRKRMY